MQVEDRSMAPEARGEARSGEVCRTAPRGTGSGSPIGAPWRRFVIPAALGILIAGGGCTTRSDHATIGPDSTLIYASKLPTDVNASITFQLKDSAKRDEEKRHDKDRGREITRLKKNRDQLLKIEEKRARQLERDAKRKAAAEKQAKKSKKGKKGKHAQDESPPAQSPADDESAASQLPSASEVRDSLDTIDARLHALALEDSLADFASWKHKAASGAPDDREVDLEDGARVQANIKLDNVYARGKRPLMFHFVWLNPGAKKIFKRQLEYAPNDSLQILTSSLTIAPSKRAPGQYTIQVFLFREEIAEKSIELRGTGVEEKEGEEEGM